MLEYKGAPWIANVLSEVGSCNGPPVTGAMPGESWHQYGLAVDCFWMFKGKAIWSANDFRSVEGRSENGYRLYHEIAEKMALTTISLKDGKDWPHIQFPEEGSPRARYSWAEIDYRMKLRYKNGNV